MTAVFILAPMVKEAEVEAEVGPLILVHYPYEMIVDFKHYVEEGHTGTHIVSTELSITYCFVFKWKTKTKQKHKNDIKKLSKQDMFIS